MKYFYTIWLLMFSVIAAAFSQQDDHMLHEQQLEDLSEADEEESEDEYDVQQLLKFKKHPININDPDALLTELPLLTPLLISNLTTYRALLGTLISVHELQAVPGFTVDVIKTILPYIVIADKLSNPEPVWERFTGGEHSVITRPTFPSKIYFRHKYQYRDILQYGVLGERDEGERALIDFYSFHLFVRKVGIVKSLAIGDYVLNLGQGLIHWQSQAFRKTSSVINIKRQAEIIRPYHSAGEYNFQRGIALTLKKYNWETSFFASKKHVTANIAIDNEWGQVITSINKSGLHQTAKERENKNNAAIISYGGNLKYLLPRGHISLNGAWYLYSYPLLKRDDLYNLFAIKGSYWSNSSIDYAYVFRNVHVFGELARSQNGSVAVINGAMASIHSTADVAVVYRNLDQGYQSIYGNVFMENTSPGNERGIYVGLSIRPHLHWRVDCYADFFKFPWLKYRVDAPSSGVQHLVQVTWKPNKQVEVYTRFRLKLKPQNAESGRIRYPESRELKNWRTHIIFQLNNTISLRSRAELSWFSTVGNQEPETGFLLYTELIYKPKGKWYSGNIRVQTFETDSYDTRLYAYENDVLFSSGTPAYYNKGMRIYINIRGKLRQVFLRGITVDFGCKAAVDFYYQYDYQSNTSNKPATFNLKLQLFLSKGK